MSIRRLFSPFSTVIAVSLFGSYFSAHAEIQSNNQINNQQQGSQHQGQNNLNTVIPENNNALHNWMPQEVNNDFWQTPNWSGFNQAAESAQIPQGKTSQAPISNQPVFRNVAPQNQVTQNPAPTNNAPQQQLVPMQSPQNNFVVTPVQKAPIQSSSSDSTKSTAAEETSASTIQNQSQATSAPQMPGFNDNYRPPMPQGNNRVQPQQYNPYNRYRGYNSAPIYPPMNRSMNPQMQNTYRPYPPTNMYQGYRPQQNGGYNQQYMPNGFMPNNFSGYNNGNNYNNGYYNRNNNWGNNNWGGNNFWGQSGPGSWTNPSKQNMEQGWDDMINVPSRMGTMPGGWTAPEVSMPNPIDVGDQFQDNIKDLPDQIRNMDVGN